MPTTLAENRAALAALQAAHRPDIAQRVPGRIVFAGNLWPNPATGVGRQIQLEVTEALAKARVLVHAGLIKVKAARRGDGEAVALMTRWFGAATAAGPHDWWQGVDYILTALNQALLRDISVYYRGADAFNAVNDYPPGVPGSGTLLTKADVGGFAETFRGANDLRIGICRTFFKRDEYKARMITLKGYDSIGGVLVHEMSHNLCNTEDHTDAHDDNYYGEDECRRMITVYHLEREAWYNADSIEYFCEEAHDGVLPLQPPLPGLDVTNLTATHEQAQIDSSRPGTSTTVVVTGVQVGDLADDHKRAQQESARPRTSTQTVDTKVNVGQLVKGHERAQQDSTGSQTSQPVQTDVDVKALREKFK